MKKFEVGQKLYMAYSSSVTKEVVLLESMVEKVGNRRLDLRSDTGRGFVYLPKEDQDKEWLYGLTGEHSEWQPTRKQALAVLRAKHVERERMASDAIVSARQVILACDAAEKTLGSEKAS